MTRTDLLLTVYPTLPLPDFDSGAEAFLAYLDRLRRVPGFDLDYGAVWEEGGEGRRPSEGLDTYLAEFRAQAARNEGAHLSIWADDLGPQRYLNTKVTWAAAFGPDTLTLDLYRQPPGVDLSLASIRPVMEAVVRVWQPAHIAFGPGIYGRDHHPMDRARLGIRWIGWVPFDLTPGMVPGAASVEPLANGTLIASSGSFWQAHPAHPAFSQEAIDRTQELEMTLNALGVLPTQQELREKRWPPA